MKRLSNIHNPLFIPTFLKGDKEEISMLGFPLLRASEARESKIPALQIRGARGVMKGDPLILGWNLRRN
jgi:hypothetical protein